MAIDHKAVAARRLKELRALRRQMDLIGERIEDAVKREVNVSLHAACVSVSSEVVQRAIEAAAQRVRDSLTGAK